MKGQSSNRNMYREIERVIAHVVCWYEWDGVCGKEGLEEQSNNKWEDGRLRSKRCKSISMSGTVRAMTTERS